jgi:hypothetical protein
MQQFCPNTSVAVRTFSAANPKVETSKLNHQAFAINLARRGDILSTARVIVPSFSALHRMPNANRILEQSRIQTQHRGIQDPTDFETIIPY